MLQRSARIRATTGWVGRPSLGIPALPLYGSMGVLLLLSAWLISWLQVKPFSTFSFFPLWLGYILFVDAIVLARRGTSLLSEGRTSFIRMFLLSAFFWWGFEALNLVVHNWRYAGTESFTPLGYVLFASLAFSTVIPGVLETATLVSSFFPPETFLTLEREPAPVGRLACVMGIGVLTFIAPFFWPDQTYGSLWISALLIVEPLNWIGGRPSIFRLLAAGRLGLLLVLGATGLICGSLWEMWNYYSFPKWYYVLPGIPGPKFFEMPLPGMLGYPPFMLEIFAVYNLLRPLFGRYSTFERVLQAPSRTL